MLSTFATLSVNSAKHLCAHQARPFATLRVTGSMFADLTGVPGSQIQFIDDVKREIPVAAVQAGHCPVATSLRL